MSADIVSPEQDLQEAGVMRHRVRRRWRTDPHTEASIIPPKPAIAPSPTPSETPEQDADIAGFLSAKHWTERELELPEPLLGEVITNTTRMFIAGPTGLGKTHLGMAMAAGMASGQGFGPWKASRQCRVLYVDGEMSRDLVQDRMRDIQRRMGDDADLSGLFVLCREDCDELAKMCPALGTMEPLNTEPGQAFLLGLIDKIGRVDVVFFDNRMSLLCGDMKEEEPWTDTMPLVKELTSKRVAQVWLDHTGHDSTKVYGTKTKEWQFDAVALLTKAENAQTDIAFTMEFTKARRRKPSNRADFATSAFAMVDDVWVVGASDSKRPTTKAPTAAAAEAEILFRHINNFLAEGMGKNARPKPGMPLVPTLAKKDLQEGLIKEGWLRLSSRLSKGGEPLESLPDKEHTRFWKRLDALKVAGKLGFDRNYVWTTKPVVLP